MNLNDVDFESLDYEQPLDQSGESGTEEIIDSVTAQVAERDVVDTSSYTTDTSQNTEGDDKKDVLTEFLKFSGIKDPEHIKFEDEDGIIKEQNWNDLSFEEKMNILTTSYQQPERDLDEDEIELVNELRRNNMTPEQYIQTIRQQAAQDYADSLEANPQYSIDDLSDDEIFMLDLQDKIEDITDEEITSALAKAKEDPLYEKKIAGMRKALKAQEDEYISQIKAEQEMQQQEQFNQFKDSVVNSIQQFNKVGDLDINLDQEDMEDIAAFILDRDESGVSYMGRALNNPQTLVEMAWWTLKGRDALNSISEYFANEIKNVRQMSYQKGLEDGKKGSSRVVYKP